MIYNKESHSVNGAKMLKIRSGTAIVSKEIETVCFEAINKGRDSFLCGDSHYKIKFVSYGNEETDFLSEAKMFFLVQKEGCEGDYVVYL